MNFLSLVSSFKNRKQEFSEEDLTENSKENLEEDSREKKEEEKYENDNNEFDSIIGEFRFKSGDKCIYTSRANLLLNNPKVIIWELNRPIDNNHVKTISDSFLEEYKRKGYVTVFGSFSVFKENDCYKIFDGQHRLEALKRSIKNNPKINPQVTIELYNTEDPIVLFGKLNQIKPQEKKLEPSNKKEQLAKALKAEYGQAIRENQSKVCRPRILLKTFLDTIILDSMYDKEIDEILAELRRINEKMSKLSMIDLFKREYNKHSVRCHRIYNEASELGVYLGIRPLKNGCLVLG